jgi:hypothetical protein
MAGKISGSYFPRLFLWGYFESKVYVTKSSNIKQRIRYEISQIVPEMLQNVRDACYYRFAICQKRKGAHFSGNSVLCSLRCVFSNEVSLGITLYLKKKRLGWLGTSESRYAKTICPKMWTRKNKDDLFRFFFL